MKYIVVANKKPIVLGRAGEDGVTTIQFSINAFFPDYTDATFGLVHQRNGDLAPYPCAITVLNGYIDWAIGSADLAKVGNGTAQLSAFKDGVIAKSVIFTTMTLDSLGMTNPPDPVKAWIDEAIQAGAAASDAATRAESSARIAGTAAQEAQEALENVGTTVDAALTEAKESGEFDGEDGVSPVITVTDITGGHVVTITDVDHPGGQTFTVLDGSPGVAGADGTDGVSPLVTVTNINGGHRVTITDADHPSGQSFNVMDGETGSSGVYIGAVAPTDPEVNVWIDPTGDAITPGIPDGGTTGQVLKKVSDTDYDVAWGNEQTIPHELPAGGTTGQFLKKSSNSDYAVEWGNEQTTHDIPDGGTTGQVLKKVSDTDYDVEWGNEQTIPHELPSGGTTGQVLKKSSNSDYAVQWGNEQAAHDIPAGGTTGQVLKKSSNSDYAVEWANEEGGAVPATADPEAIGTAAVGSSSKYAKEDHVHDYADDFKTALLLLASKIVYVDGGGLTYLEDLQNALYHRTLESIDAEFTQPSSPIYNDIPLDDLKQYLVVTANYDVAPTEVELADSAYTLSMTGDLAVGSNTVTVTYRDKTYTFTVTITQRTYLYNWDFTQSLTDSVHGTTLTSPSGRAPTQDSSGLTFSAAKQQVTLPEKIEFAGKTLEVDIASMSFAGNSAYHSRFLMLVGGVSSTSGLGPFIWRNTGAWEAYGADGNLNDVWSAPWSPTLTGTAADTYAVLSGKKLKMVFSSDGHTMSLYLDNVLQGTLDTIYFEATSTGSYLMIGGLQSGENTAGNQLQNTVLTGMRIYAN